MPLNGKSIDFTKRFHPCKHFHVSSRRCGNRIPKDKLMCPLHSTGKCVECESMLKAFEPPKGWSPEAHR